jgi:hypothetical protein
MTRVKLLWLLAMVLAVSSQAVNAAIPPTPLLLPQSTAFSMLGHSCGGIREQAFATGFDSSGYPTGDVYLQTRCGGSGRGGGYHVTTYSAWAAVTWDFSGDVRSSARLTAAPAVSATFSATDANGDQIYNTLNAVNVVPSACTVANTTYCTYRAYLTVPAPGAPTSVAAIQVGDEFQVSWKPSTPNATVITSSTITATPIGSTAQIVTATETGSAETGFVGPLQPLTTYQITVVSTDAGGSSPPSAPITATTQPASVPPSAPTGVTARWLSPGAVPDTLMATWAAAVPGDSPTDQYQITIRGSDGGGTFTQSVSGSTLTASFSVNDIPDWSVSVRAHNAAGWSPWSAPFLLGGE